MNPQTNTLQDGEDELDIRTRIEMLEIIKPLTDYLREITSHHDINGLNSLAISSLLPFIQAREREARVDERQLALSDLDAENQIQQRDYELSRDFLNGWQDAITAAANIRDARLQQLQHKPQAGDGEGA